MLKALLDEVESMKKQMGYVNREIKIQRLKEILEIKNKNKKH